jgi:hypothetical protein
VADIIKPQTYPWQVFCYDPNRQWPDLPEPIRAEFGSLQAWQQQSSATRPGVRFLISPTGLPDLRVNAFFTSEGMLFRSEHTQRKYAYALAGWLNFLARLDPSIA